jgi:ATP-binding protein involved in chromosome partitioning
MSATSAQGQVASTALGGTERDAPTIDQVMHALAGVHDPEIRKPITELGMVKDVEVTADGTVHVQVWLTVSGCPLRDTITRDVQAAVGKLPGVSGVLVTLDVMSDEHAASCKAG